MPSPQRHPATRSRIAVLRWLALAAVAIGGTLVAFWQPQFLSGGTGDRPQSASGAGAARPASAPRRSPLAARYAPGDVLRYALTYESAIDTNDGGRFFQLSASGDLELRVVSVAASETLLALTMANARLTSQHARAQQADAYRQAEAALATPAFITLDGHGAVRAIRIAGNVPHTVADLTRALASLSQYVVPDAASAAWTSAESDVTGTYQAEYRSLGSARRSSKRKLSYTQIPQQPGVDGDLRVDVISSEGEFALDGLARIERMQMREAIRTMSPMLPVMTSTTSLVLARKSVGRDETQLSALRERADALAPVALDAPVTSENDEADVDRTKVAGRSFGDFMRSFAALPSKIEQETPEQRDQRRRLFIELAALLRLDDRAVDQAMEQILSGEMADASLLWDALASAGSPKAQLALRQLFDDPRFDESEHRTQLIGLSFVQKPTKETVQYLAGKVQDADHGQQARFGLGTAANHLGEKDPQLAEQAVSALLELLDDAKNEQERSDYLLALGNSNSPAAKPAVLGAIKDPARAVRAAAATALRYLEGEDVDAALLALMTQEPEALVRANAFAAARVRAPSRVLLDAVYDASEHDDDASVRREAGSTLNEWQRAVPEIGAALAQYKQPTATQ